MRTTAGDESRLASERATRAAADSLREARCRAISSRRSITSACSSATSRRGVATVTGRLFGADSGRVREMPVPSNFRQRASSSCWRRSCRESGASAASDISAIQRLE